MDGDLDRIMLALLGFFAALALLLVLMGRREPNRECPRPPRAGLRVRIQCLGHPGSGTDDDGGERP